MVVNLRGSVDGKHGGLVALRQVARRYLV